MPASKHLRCRVELPSGRLTDAILDAEQWCNHAHPVHKLRFDAHVLMLCPSCWNDTACVQNALASGISIAVDFYCANCGWRSSGFITEALLSHLETLEANQRAQLARTHLRFDLAVMSDEVESFISALQAGYVVPEDF